MRHRTQVMLRLFAIVAAMGIAFAGMMASPASAQSDSGIAAPCQVTGSEGLDDQINDDDQACEDLIFSVLPEGCDLDINDDTFQFIGNECAEIQQGECPGNITLDDGTIIQFQCEGISPTSTPVTPGVTPTTPVATTVPGETATATATVPDATATATDVVTDTETETDTDTDTETETDTETDTDTDTGTDTDTDTTAPVDELPDTGQGPTDNGGNSAMVLVLGMISMLMAVGAFAWQRRQTA